MKKLLPVLAMMLFVSFSYAKSASLFSYDAAKVEKALVSVNVLDDYVSQAMVSADELQLDNPVLKNFSATPALPAGNHPVLGIPSFLWGLVLGWVGILIVYLVSEDNEETKKALYGCIAGTVAGLACYFLFWGAIFTSAAASY